VGAHATELIHELAVARENEYTVEEIDLAIHAHPTLSEAIAEAALDSMGRPRRLRRGDAGDLPRAPDRRHGGTGGAGAARAPRGRPRGTRRPPRRVTRPLEVVDLGRRAYHDALALQRALRLHRLDGSLPHDLLLLVEHDPVYTLGRGTKATSLPQSIDALRAAGAEVVEIERGGDVTWHGPGQLVGYPILHLAEHREDLHWYLRQLEQVLIDAVATVGVSAERVPGKTGIWSSGAKLASIGIHVKQWVTLHGFALNVDPDLAWFDRIVPCGLEGVTMTSVADQLDRVGDPALAGEVRQAVIGAMGATFQLAPVLREAGTLPAG
jgi:lipoyl(octanoyl) transferase